MRRAPAVAVASHLLLQDAIDGSDEIGRWDWDIPNDRIYADAIVALLFNVDPAAAEAGAPLGLFLNGVHPDDRKKTADLIARRTAAGRSYVQEYRVNSADGVTRWVLARGLIRLDGAGRPQSGTGFLIDITRDRAEEAAYAARMDAPSGHLIERAAEHCLAVRSAVRELPEPLLHNMTDMLLFEIGRKLAGAVDVRNRTRMN
jgi:hypothetical protein